jgi:hypothetical protein
MGPAGATGVGLAVAPTQTYGTFISFDNRTYTNNNGVGNANCGVILPVTQAITRYPTTAFTLNSNGTVTINETGTYLASGKAQINNNRLGQAFALQVNGTGLNTSDYNAVALSPNNSTAVITTMLRLNAGAVVSMSFLSGGPVDTTSHPGNMVETTPSVAITLVKIAPTVV